MRDWCERTGHTVVMEYVEPGASATDDKRPVFQQLIAEAMLADMKKQIKAAQEGQDEGLKKLTKELDELKLATERLFEAVEKGLLPLNSTLQERSHRLQARRQELRLPGIGGNSTCRTLSRISYPRLPKHYAPSYSTAQADSARSI